MIEISATLQLPDQTECQRKKKHRLFWNHIDKRDCPTSIPIFDIRKDEEDQLLLNPIDYFRKFIKSGIIDLHTSRAV